ncbi:hypothetical protein [Spirosoma foliorum]|uniref:Uncharacterized protein n=1 Tax=Spirosoma foliorum TaxID=2710596 RepID=A0A7G5H4S8_9BACT|nr:hypothetical protein [Spirosoma foliorum]QMW06120.1 hypothetical protein H3H32_15105 [Spirosoma foliorum]
MKQVTNRTWQGSRPSRRERTGFDQTTALGSLAVALLAYIVYHIYPLISNGLLW